MANTDWLKQSDKPLFDEILWSRPENKKAAKKMLVVGGNIHGFHSLAEAYNQAEQAGIGELKAIYPDKLKTVLGSLPINSDTLPSTGSGAFAKNGLNRLLAYSDWANGILFCGDLGKNSETTVLLENFLKLSKLPICLCQDAFDIAPIPLLSTREQTLLVLSLGQLQALGKQLNFPSAFTSNLDLLGMVDALATLSKSHSFMIITKHIGQTIVASKGKVSTTPVTNDGPSWTVTTAAKASVWWLQHPESPFEALTTSVFSQ